MKSLPNFASALVDFVHEETRQEAQGILQDKDAARTSLTIQDVKDFDYNDQFRKFQKTNPILVASILGTLSRVKGEKPENISRKGFGGARSGEGIDLIPAVVQTVSRVLKALEISFLTSLVELSSSVGQSGSRPSLPLF